MEKEQFTINCQRLAAEPGFKLSEYVLSAVNEHKKRISDRKLPVIWIETSDSGDNNIAFMNTTYPYLGQVFTDLIDLHYSNTFMAAQGEDSLNILQQAASKLQGKFTLVVEGAVPLKDNGLYSVIARTETHNITALEAVTWLGPLAEYVVAMGTCASFGGISAARPNITGSVVSASC